MSVHFQCLDPVVPDTQPAASRMVPPRYPPAPPGTAGAGGSDDQRRAGASLLDALEVVRGPLDQIRFALDTLESVAHDTPLAEGCRDVIDWNRLSLEMELVQLRGRLEANGRQFFDTDLQTVRRELARMARKGISREALDVALGVDVFQSVSRTEATGQERVPDPSYHFSLPPHSPAARLGLITPARFLTLVLDQLLAVLDTQSTSFTLHAFDTHFTQSFLALYQSTRLATRPAGEPYVAFTLRQFGFDPFVNDPEELQLQRLRTEEQSEK
ncbi:MAG: hypothetical protein K0Q72_1074 [Armatimonadetes bacterium]|jgi:hypothetical protein|nr:hypothetical protein [Armatimonadota bacterium]